MRLGVDGLRLMGNRLGVGRYIEYLLRCWTDAQHPFSEIVAYTPGAVEIPGLGRGKVRVEPLGPSSPHALWEHAVLPLRKSRDDRPKDPWCQGGAVAVDHAGGLPAARRSPVAT